MKKTIGKEFITPVMTRTPYINFDGAEESNKYCLSVTQKDGKLVYLKKVTNDYYYMDEIFDDHFIVCDVNRAQSLESKEEHDDSLLSYSFGVIALQRDNQGNVIPMAERIVVPILYYDISKGNLGTLTALVNDHFTYIDINPKSENFGKQLVPAVLEYAAPFSTEYEGFARCSVNGVVGYLPRDYQPRTSLNSSDLLTEEQVEFNVSNDKVKRYGIKS